MDVSNSNISATRSARRARIKLRDLSPVALKDRTARRAAEKSAQAAFRAVPVDPAQRYTVPEAIAYLRLSRKGFYDDVKAGRIKLVKDGRRSYVHGSELIRRSAASRTDA